MKDVAISQELTYGENINVPRMYEDEQESSMSIQTLLDAAKFVECTNTPDIGARAPDPPEFHHYAKSPQDRKRSNSGSDKSDQNDDGKERRKYGGTGNREVHNILEKNRRAHLKECFDALRLQIPTLENHNKVSNLSILRGAFKYVQMLKRKEKELEQELQQLVLLKMQRQQDTIRLQKDLNNLNIPVDISHFMPPPDEDTRSVSTATAENSSPIMSEDEEADMEISPVKVEIIETTPQPLLSFHNAINHSPTVSPPQVSQVTSNVTKSLLPGPLFTMKTAPTNKVISSQTSTVSNNKTIAAMLSTSAQSNLPDSMRISKASVLAVTTTSTVSANTTPLFAGNSLVSLLPNNLTTSTLPPNPFTGKIMNEKTSVTQLLQQTIAHRAQLQQLAKLQQQVAQPGAIVVSAASGSLTPAITVAQIGSLPQVIAMNASSLRPVAALKTVPQLRPAVALNHVLPTAFTLNSAGQLVTTSADGGVESSNTVQLASLPKPVSIASAVTVSTVNSTVGVSPVTLTSTGAGSISVPGLSGLQALNLAGLKPILTLPLTQLPTTSLSSQHVTTLQQLMSQAVAKSSAFRAASGEAGSISTSTVSSTLATISPASLTQVTPAAITPITVTPMLPIMMTPPASANTTPLNLASTAINSQVLKSLGLPILQQPIGLPIKPIVMVTVANATTSVPLVTASTPTLQVKVPVTHS